MNLLPEPSMDDESARVELAGREELLSRVAVSMASATDLETAVTVLLNAGAVWLGAEQVLAGVVREREQRVLIWRWPGSGSGQPFEAQPLAKWARLLGYCEPSEFLGSEMGQQHGQQGAAALAVALNVEGRALGFLAVRPTVESAESLPFRLKLLASVAAANVQRLRDRLRQAPGYDFDSQRSAEMRAAQRVQKGFNSVIVPASRQTKEFSVQVFQRQSAGIGGDGYFYQPYAGGRLLAGVVDVSGKGVSGAMGLARFMTLIKQAFAQDPEPIEKHLTEINRALQEDARRSCTTVSLTAVWLDPTAGNASAWAFGAPRPRAYTLSHQWQTVECQVHPPLGLRRLEIAPANELPLDLYRHWLLVSDGIEEAQNTSGETFAPRRLTSCLSDQPADPLGSLTSAWEKHLAADFTADDATALLLTRKLPGLGQPVTVPCNPAMIYRLREMARWWMADVNMAAGPAQRAELALDEVLTNIWKHAYQKQGISGDVSLTADAARGTLIFTLRHTGDGITDESTTILRNAGPRKDGGRGLRLIYDLLPSATFSRDAIGYVIRLPVPLRDEASGAKGE